MNKIIYFDIDDTLVDTHKLALSFYKQISDETNIPLEKIIESKEKYKLTLERTADYIPEDLMKFVCNDLNIDQTKINNPFDNETLYKNAIFPETKETLEKLSKEYTLGVFSEGFENYQMKKIKLSGLLKFFDKNLIVIEKRKTANKSINKIKPGNMVVDDKKEVADKLLELSGKNFKVIWINRKTDETIDGTRTVKNLGEI